ncbi:hypothetical protein LCGC14_1005910 [marine sediment metagenome]|uniref:Uncharacterized protein n=1 Tax=marine sediment metagenome TaxID=412755 RepID=A0A0F9NN57_9ZZZZ
MTHNPFFFQPVCIDEDCNVINPTKEFYHNCLECSRFSGAFGGAPYMMKTGYLLRQDTEESYERLKELFVKHFNEEHRDLIRNRKIVSRRFKKISKLDEAVAESTRMAHRGFVTGAIAGSVNITHDYVTSRQAFGLSEFHAVSLPDVTGSTIPEYETISPIQTSLQSLRARNGRGAGRMRN